MSFSGTAIIHRISPSIVRISGLSLIASSSGTIGLVEATGAPPDVRLPASFDARPFSFRGEVVPLQASVKVDIEPVSDGPLTNLPCSIQKSGSTPEDFRITVINTNTTAETQSLEIYVESLAGTRSRGAQTIVTVVNNSSDIDIGEED